MTEKLSSKRPRLPRLNASDIYGSMSSDSSEDEDEVANIVKRRKSLRPVQGNSENSFDSNHNKSVELNNLIPQNNSAEICEELEAKLKKAEEDVKYWQNKYEELRNRETEK
ncbi:hypothetical protein PV327_011324 [Microctonus hyperodae]|uniref:Uncharacterized protein n=1 Tax=Microctonus hyperodae TaxID=165561 RepID=A0AA39EXW3_MICHY|nr:hypothetical protein PV327_011324 [Microctonus hyperodae]